MLFSPDALKRPRESYPDGRHQAEKGRLVNVPRRRRQGLHVPRFLLLLLQK